MTEASTLVSKASSEDEQASYTAWPLRQGAPPTFRVATHDDGDLVAEIIHGSPGEESIALFGGRETARRFGLAFIPLQGRKQGWHRTILAEVDSAPVGVLQWRRGSDPGVPLTLDLVRAAVRSLGVVGAVRAWLRQAARKRVNPKAPPDAFHIDEVHVHPQHRGAGIGGRLLRHAEEVAVAHGYTKMSLVTHTANPARRLYDRYGFEVVERREDPEYQRLTGISGRILMVKQLRSPRAA